MLCHKRKLGLVSCWLQDRQKYVQVRASLNFWVSVQNLRYIYCSVYDKNMKIASLNIVTIRLLCFQQCHVEALPCCMQCDFDSPRIEAERGTRNWGTPFQQAPSTLHNIKPYDGWSIQFLTHHILTFGKARTNWICPECCFPRCHQCWH